MHVNFMKTYVFVISVNVSTHKLLEMFISTLVIVHSLIEFVIVHSLSAL